MGAPINRHLHYDSQTANLMTHFEVLQAFCQHIHSLQQQTTTNAEQQQQQNMQQSNNIANNRNNSDNSNEEK